MTDDTNKPKSSWTDRQRLAYIFSLLDYSNIKLDFTNGPRPEGKTVGACRIMVDRLKNSLKDDIEALRSGGEVVDAPKKEVAAPRKRKAKGDDEGKGGARKRGKGKKSVEEDGDGDEAEVKGKGVKVEDNVLEE